MTCVTLRERLEGSTSYPLVTKVESKKASRNRSVSDGETNTSNGGQQLLSESCARSVQYFAASALVAMVAFLWVADGMEVNMTAVTYVHLLSFAAHFGAQCWVTFVAGITMFFTLPRNMFGCLQSRLFPLYFATSLALSIVAMVTFLLRHPYILLTSVDHRQLILLGVCVGCSFVNSFFLAPKLVASMIHMFELEKALGVASVVGYCDRKELKKDPVYSRHYKTFRISHSVSGLGNLATLSCNLLYMYQIACNYLELQRRPLCDI